jgi:hypothetical protein
VNEVEPALPVGIVSKVASYVKQNFGGRATLDLSLFLFLLLLSGTTTTRQCWLAGSETQTWFAVGSRSALLEQEQDQEQEVRAEAGTTLLCG